MTPDVVHRSVDDYGFVESPSLARSAVDTYAPADIRLRPGASRPNEIVYVRQLRGDGPRLRAPLKIQFMPDEEGLLVEAFAPAIHLSGVGESDAEALKDLMSTIVGLWDELTQTPEDCLHPSAVEQLDVLRSALL